ncbi:unnamed protein product [Onchocerca flexuosa]|uniref:Integrase n=1 Tax=Onchocerca flexuosa TaxID=387005 RepID=A0A183H6Q3_9BILA|nr:unnamed protein product [Onchocerca flexuosa]
METMSTQQCIQAFKRFISRRKQPIFYYAKNLIAASKVVIELNRIGGETLKWEFITPGAPWQGGICERMAGVAKRSLRRAIETKFSNNAELITLVEELEVIINESLEIKKCLPSGVKT